MSGQPFNIIIGVVLVTSLTLAGCDRFHQYSEQELIQRAKDFEDQGNLKGSIIELKNALQKNPNSVQARLLLGQIYLKNGMGHEAEKEFRRALELGANREAHLPQLGEALLSMGEYSRVLSEIQVSDQTSKLNRARILQIRGHALLKSGKLKDGCDLFEQSRMSDANIPQTYWGLAQCAVANHDLAEARKWLDTAIQLPNEKARTYLFLGDWEQLNDNPKAALAAYSSALKIEPDNLLALENRVRLNLKFGQIEAAHSDTQRVEKLYPKTAPAYYLRALLNFQKKDFSAAWASLQEVFKTMPNHGPSLLLAGITAFKLESFEQAESNLRRYLLRYPRDSYGIRALAATQIKQNQPEKAIETLTPLISPDSKDTLALILAGEAARGMGHSEQAAKWYARASAIDSKNAMLRTQMGLNYLSMGDIPQGLSELQAAAVISPTSHEADNFLALAYLEQKQFDKALLAIQALEKKLPRNPAVYVLRGQAYAGKKDFLSARQNYEAALAIDPLFYPAVASLAQMDIFDKKLDAARKRFEAVLNKDKNHLQAMLALAQLATLEKNNRAALTWLEKGAAAYPQALEPRLRLIPLYLEAGAYQKALTLANEANQTHPDSPQVLDMLGTAQLAAGQKENALVTTNRLVEKMPRAPAAYLKLAQVQYSLGKYDTARITLNKALSIQPDSLLVLNALIKINLETKRYEDALRIARQTQTALPKSAEGFLQEGVIYLAQQKPASAMQSFAQALTLDRKNTTLIRWHQAASLSGNAQNPDAQLLTWLKSNPADYPVRAYLAQHFMNGGRIREAIEQYEMLLQYTPNSLLGLNNLAALYHQEKDPRALPLAERAYKLYPNHVAIQDTLGWLLVEQGQPKRGLPLLEAASSKQPNATIRYHYAVALARTGAKSEARAILEQLISNTPTFPELDSAKALLRSLS